MCDRSAAPYDWRKRHTRIYVTRRFARFAAKEKIDDAALAKAVRRAEKRLIDVNPGSGLVKRRIARRAAIARS